MGCQNSKLGPEAAAVPPKVRPLLRRRLDEMRRRRKHGMSRKELLKHGHDDYSHSHGTSVKTTTSSSLSHEESDMSNKAKPCTTNRIHEISHKAEPIMEENETFPKAEQKTEESVVKSSVVPRPEMVEEKSDMIPIMESGDRNEEEEPEECKSIENEGNLEESNEVVENIDRKEDGEEEKRNNKIMEAVIEKETTNEVKDEEDEDENDDADDEDTSDDEGLEAKICPGSPSFRVYCIQTLPNAQEIDCKSIESPKEIVKHTKSYSTDSNINISPDNGKPITHVKSRSIDSVHSLLVETTSSSTYSNHEEVQVAKTKKKGKKVKKIGRAMRKGGSVKHLFKVQSCYHSSKSSSHEHANLLVPKYAVA